MKRFFKNLVGGLLMGLAALAVLGLLVLGFLVECTGFRWIP